ncbi:MAG: AI-2E family transporter [bacterium]
MKKENIININITPESILKGIGFVLLIWFLYFIKDLVLVVLVAVVLASGMEPLISWFKKCKISRLPAAIISYLGMASIFIGLMFFFIPQVLNEASSLLTELPKYFESANLWNPLNINNENVSTSQKVIQTLSEGVNNPNQLVHDTQNQMKSDFSNTSFGLNDIIKNIREISSDVSGGFIKIVSIIFGGLLSFVLIIVLSFYLLVQENGVANFLCLIMPAKYEKYIVDLWKRSQKKIGQWMQVQLLLGIIVGVLVYLGLMILGIKNALLLAALAGCLEIIPIFGPILSAIPAVLMAFIGGDFTSAILVLGLYIIIQQFENHLIYPLIVKKVIGISPVIVILVLIIGAKLAGFLGIVLAVPIISASMEFIDDIQKRKNLFWENGENKS